MSQGLDHSLVNLFNIVPIDFKTDTFASIRKDVMKSILHSTCLAALLVASFFAPSTAHSQMRPHARYEGEMLPILSLNDTFYHVLEGTKKRSTRRWEEYEIRPDKTFSEGFVEITNIEVDYDPLRDASIKERSKPNSVNFRYEVDITPDRTLPNCYALLTLVSKGSIGTQFLEIGTLKKGRTKHLELEMVDRYDLVGSLHIFSESHEVRTNQTPQAYELAHYQADLLKHSRGVSAVELLKSEERFPHVLSNDGRFLATTRDRDTHYSLIAYDLESMRLLCDVKIGEHDDTVRDLHWVSDKELAFVSDNKLMLLNIETKTHDELRADVWRIVGSVPNQPELLILACYKRYSFWNMKYNVATRKAFDVDEFSEGATMFSDQGDARVRYKSQHDGLLYFVKPKADSRWVELDKQVKEPGLRFSYRGNEILDRVADVHAIGPDGDTLYISTRLNSDTFQLSAFSISEGVIKKTIAKHPVYDLGSDDTFFSRILFRKNSAEMIGLVFETEKPRVTWLDEGFARVQKVMEETFPDHSMIPVDWSEDGTTFIYYAFSDRDPGTYFVFRPLEGKVIPVLRLGDRLKDKTLAKTIPLEFKSRDGATIFGYVTYPPEESDQPAPLIVDIHGGPTVRDSWGFRAANQYFATRGYIVLQVNYRGSSGYGAKYQNAGLRARLDTVVLDDIADGVRHLVEQGKADPERIGVMGGSFGGWATYMSLIEYPELYRAGVAIAAVSHWRKMMGDDRWGDGNKLGYSFWKALLDFRDFDEEEKFVDPLTRAGELNQPVYIMHGELDRVVRAQEAKLMLDALRKHNDHVQSLSFPRSSHSYWPFEDRVRQLNEIGEFFDRHLAAKSGN